MQEGQAGVTEGADAALPDRLEDLYVRYAPGGFHLAYLLTGDQQRAEDLVHDAFLQVIGRLGQFRTGVAFDAYLRRTIVNLTKNRWRHAAVIRKHQAREAPPTESMPSAESAIVERDVIWRTVVRMPMQQRTAIVLRFYEDLAEDDIAAVMGCRPGTVRSLVSRGLATLRQDLGVIVDAEP